MKKMKAKAGRPAGGGGISDRTAGGGNTKHRPAARRFERSGRLLFGLMLIGALWGCAMGAKTKTSGEIPDTTGAGTIIAADTAQPIRFEALIADLEKVRVVYVGEEHTDPAHHQVQLQILKALYALCPDLSVGMEMFDRSYQPVLDRWSAGQLDREEFIQRTHWYVNWRYDYNLYAGILDFIREKRIPLKGLNLPFHIPPKIRIGGIDSLLGCDASYLPREVDTSNAAHRAWVESIFKEHHGAAGMNFEFFYQAQCVWEDVMAASIAEYLDGRMTVVFVGNGHIYRKFGVPDRAFKRTQAPFRTVYPSTVGRPLKREDADFFWITPKPQGK